MPPNGEIALVIIFVIIGVAALAWLGKNQIKKFALLMLGSKNRSREGESQA